MDAAQGLRERKKQRTRDELINAAYDLFQRKGFEATTIDEIADAVQLSSRTFFRYFASKDDVVLGLQEQMYAATFAAFDRRPPAEAVLDACRSSVVEVLRDCEGGTDGFDAGRFRCMQQLITDSPALAARCMEQCTGQVVELSRRIAARMGVDADADPRPYLVASVATVAVQAATGRWRELEPGTPVSVLVDRAFALIGGGLNYAASSTSPPDTE